MASTPGPDFARVARLRGAEQGAIREAARQRPIPEDIAEALTAPGVGARAASLVLLTASELSLRRGQVVEQALTASYRIRQLAEQLPEGAPVPPDTAESLHRIQELVNEVQRITLEIQRRSRLTERHRAEEEAVRRARAEQFEAAELPKPRHAAIELRIPVSRRRQHTEAEEELQHHRPTTGSNYGGVRT